MRTDGLIIRMKAFPYTSIGICLVLACCSLGTAAEHTEFGDNDTNLGASEPHEAPAPPEVEKTPPPPDPPPPEPMPPETEQPPVVPVNQKPEPEVTPYGNIEPLDETKRWELFWGDEFGGTSLDLTKWKYTPSHWERGRRVQKDNCKVRWNWQDRDNTSIADGHLILRNTKETLQSEDDDDVLVSASAIYSKGVFETTYGYFEARIKIAPPSSGIHTAFWLFGNGIEIDILESTFNTNFYQLAIHWKREDGRDSQGQRIELDSIHNEFNIFGLYWDENEFRFYTNGELKYTYSGPLEIADLDKHIYLSTGAHWKKKIGSACTGQFPNEALVDYIRVWKSIDK